MYLGKTQKMSTWQFMWRTTIDFLCFTAYPHVKDELIIVDAQDMFECPWNVDNGFFDRRFEDEVYEKTSYGAHLLPLITILEVINDYNEIFQDGCTLTTSDAECFRHGDVQLRIKLCLDIVIFSSKNVQGAKPSVVCFCRMLQLPKVSTIFEDGCTLATLDYVSEIPTIFIILVSKDIPLREIKVIVVKYIVGTLL
ncbi:hypothetical protein ACJX0J_028854 [Zea mays]